nr:hypothetical protein CFP56_22677 [Quercus suber]
MHYANGVMRKLRTLFVPFGVAKYSRRFGGKKKSSKINSSCVLWTLEICGLARIEVVIRDAEGRVRGALSDRTVLPRTVEEVEAIACRTAVRFVLKLGLVEVVFERDSEMITTAINSLSPCCNSFGHIMDDVKALALNFAPATFVHIKRQGNDIADKLAKASKCIPCPHFWSNDISGDVQQLVVHDSIL